MSTSDAMLPGGTPPTTLPSAPTQAGLLASQGGAPTSGATPNATVPSPGVALAAAHVPGSPTLPDADPVASSMMLARLANEMFAAPGAPVDVPTISPASMTSPPPEVPASPGVSPSLGVPMPTSPFASELSFDALDRAALGPFDVAALQLRLVDAAPSLPAIDGAPYWIPVETVTPSAASPHPPGPVEPAIAVEPWSVPGVHEPRTRGVFDPVVVRSEFPILQERVHGKRLVWLDNAATTHKPQTVIDRISHFYEHENSNIHRAAHTLAARATDAYESARQSVTRFIGASSSSEVVFVRGATEGINLVAQSWGRRNLNEGDEVVITWLEHHANIVPWHRICEERKAILRVAPVDSTGAIILESYEKLLGPRTKLVALPQVSNALGTVTPAAEMVQLAHRHGAKVLVDGAQSVSHMHVDVQALDCDFFVFSGHKVFAPTGIGVVWGRRELLDEMPPWQGGGNMIRDVTFERIQYHPAPERFEAGTGNIADAVGLGAALDWLERLGRSNVERYEHELLEYAHECLRTVAGLTIIGTAPHKAGVVSFILDGQKTEEVGGILDQDGIAVRSGHHCAQPILRRFGLEATVRASFAPYNTRDDVDALTAALRRLQAGR